MALLHLSSRAYLLLGVFALIVAFLCVESLLPSLVVAGRHAPATRGNFMYLNFNNVSPTRVQAVTHHEMAHDWTQRGVLDIDIPTAAALEYYWEWDNTGTLEDASRIDYFMEGLESTDTAADVSGILNQYLNSSDLEQLVLVEDRQSYNDGARLAGLAYQQFQGDQGFRYLLLLSSLCDHALARDAVRDGDLADFILGFRSQTTMFVDIFPGEIFRQHLERLDDTSREKAEEYVAKLIQTHGFYFMKNRPTLIDAMP